MHKIGCVIPCYMGGNVTIEVLEKTLEIADSVVLVDDCCPLNTGKMAEKIFAQNSKLKIICSSKNCGVGMSTKIGFAHLIKEGCDVVIKIDADGQIDPRLSMDLIKPILRGTTDAAKGNRFSSLDHMLSMPIIRIIGNLGLSFLNKISTGYWELFDPTNGFIAFKASSLKRVRYDRTDDRYFFESDLLFQCSLAQITFSQLPMSSIYGDEISTLRPMKEINRFAGKHLINFFKRLVYQYFILDFNSGSLEIIGGLLGLFVTLLFSFKILIFGIFYNRYATPGESSLFAIISIITMQMLIAFLYYDATQQPLLRRLKSR